VEINPGYKKTEVGVIPEDWDVKSLGDIGESLIGLTYKPADVRSDGILVLRSSNIYEGTFRFNDNVFVKIEIPERIMVQPGDILICVRNGSRDLIGKCVLIDKRAQGMTFGAFMAVFRSSFHNFVFQQFKSWVINRQIHEHLGATINQITNKSLNSFKIPLPPTKAEQEAIAEALSDTDALIESLEQLIAKKRQIKQGAMQELLSGKKRLPGFNGKWEVKRLGDIAEIIMGQSPGSLHYNTKGDGLPLIQGNADISNRKTIMRVFTTEITKRGRCGDILMSVRAPVGEVSYAVFDVCLGRGVCAIRYPNEFLYQALIAKEPTWAKLSKGSTFDSVNSADVKAFEIGLPKDEKEQTAIDAILSDMDTEIAALEEKLAKANQIKQGMMQELLTGRIRLI
jgi:type I restriction enzyme S subunit